MTEYVSARWYRAPEIIIREKYDHQVDVFSLGCIMAELYLGIPLFPGNTEIDMISMMNKFYGTKMLENWPEFMYFCQKTGIMLPISEGISIGNKLSNASNESL